LASEEITAINMLFWEGAISENPWERTTFSSIKTPWGEVGITYTDINELWGEVFIGASQAVENSKYNRDQHVLVAYNAYECDARTYAGAATVSGCEISQTPGRFEISTPGTYYLLFRSGVNTYGTSSVMLDNWTVTATE
jgi:hypothetical protein